MDQKKRIWSRLQSLENVDTKVSFISYFNAEESPFCLAHEGLEVANLTGLKIKSLMCKEPGLSSSVVPLLKSLMTLQFLALQEKTSHGVV